MLVRTSKWLGVCSVALGSIAALGCGSRHDKWNQPVDQVEPTGLSGAVAMLDAQLDRVMFVTSPRDGSDGAPRLRTSTEPVGKGVLRTLASEDGERLFVLSRGEVNRTDPDDEPPQLLVFDGSADAGDDRLLKRFELDDPLTNLALDPRGQWVGAFRGQNDQLQLTVSNPNELVLLSLQGDDVEGRAESKTIRSFGGAPEDLIFTEDLMMPNGSTRRFMLVRTDRDVTLVDLSDLDLPEITVPLTEDEEQSPFAPAQVIYDDGDPDDPNDARLAVRLVGTSDVVLLDFAAPKSDDRAFSIVPNIIDVGGEPSTIDFVRTDGGLRLAVLVPGRNEARLVDPETTFSEVVELSTGFQQMRRITDDLGESSESGDVALLWGSERKIAFWSLGSSSSSPFRSVDTTDLNISVSQVLDVPAPNQHLKVLQSGDGNQFFVLDMEKRQSSPLNTSTGGFEVEVARDGERVWAYRPDSSEFAAIALEDLHPVSLFVEPRVDVLFDIAQAEGDRALIALHLDGGWSATTLDAREPQSSVTSFFPALHFGDLQ